MWIIVCMANHLEKERESGYKGVGRKTSNAGRAAVKASKVKDLKSAQSATNAALKASGKK